MTELFCPTCGRALPAKVVFCDLDHGDRGPVAGLTRAAIERTPRAWRHLLGLTIADAWRTDGFLGAGGMGVVLSAVQLSVSRTVALKLLPIDAQTDSDLLRRFEREARLMASLTDPNLVMLFEFGETSVGSNAEDRLFFIAMERVEGPTLTEALSRHGAFGTAEAVALSANMLRGLAAAHEAGVVHRDLKPGNVMIDQAKRRPHFARLIDFGISSLHGAGGAQTLAARGGVMGTPKYMAPEQWRAEHADPSTDIYAFGAMLVELLTGTPPVPKGEPREMALAHCTGPRPVLTVDGLGQPVPIELARFIDRCLAVDREARYPHASAALVALLEIEAGLAPTPWPPVPAGDPTALAPIALAPIAPVSIAPAPTAPERAARPAVDPALAALLDQDWDQPAAPVPAPPASAPADSEPAAPAAAPSTEDSAWGAPPATDAPSAKGKAPADEATAGWMESWSTALAAEATPIMEAGAAAAPPAALDDALGDWPDTPPQPAASNARANSGAPPQSGSAAAPRENAPASAPLTPGPARDSRGDETWGVTGTALPPAPALGVNSRTGGRANPTPLAAKSQPLPRSWIAAGLGLVVVLGGLVVWRLTVRDEVAEAAAEAQSNASDVPAALPDAAPPSIAVSAAPIPGPPNLADRECVVISVRPGGVKFVQVPTNTVLCEDTAICRVPIDVDTRLELAGHEPKVISGDDLYDRRGGKWSVVLQPKGDPKRKRDR